MTKENQILTNLRVTDVTQAKSVMKSKSDLSNRLFDKIKLEGILAKQSLFPGVIFRNCEINNCDLSRSDFEGARFENCKLTNVSFKNTDIRSTSFGSCEILECNFSDAFISDSVFQNCNIISTVFNHSNILKSKFIDTNMIGITNIQSTLLHNDFFHVSFDGVRFGDCTALYSYFEECSYIKFAINVDSLGLSFGITASDINTIELIFLGNTEKKPSGFNIEDHIVKQFEIRQWPLQTIIAMLNFHLLSPMDSWPKIFNIFKHQIKIGAGAKIDDALFVIKLMRHMMKKRELPFLTIIICKDILIEIKETLRKKEDVHDNAVLEQLETDLHSIFLIMEENLHAVLNELSLFKNSEKFNCDMVFFQKPSIDIEGYFLDLLAFANINDSLISFSPAVEGSWIKPFQTTASCLSILLISLYLVEGCIIKITSIRARAEVLVNSNLPVGYIEEAARPKQDIPPEIRAGILALYESYSKKNLKQVDKHTGVSQKNIQEIIINR